MTPGLRTHKAASLRVAIAEGLPSEMWNVTREILDVHSTNPRKGHATALLHEVCVEADNWWMTLIVQVRPFDDGMTLEQLARWYSRFGFNVVQESPCLMARSPQPPKIERIH